MRRAAKAGAETGMLCAGGLLRRIRLQRLPLLLLDKGREDLTRADLSALFASNQPNSLPAKVFTRASSARQTTCQLTGCARGLRSAVAESPVQAMRAPGGATIRA